MIDLRKAFAGKRVLVTGHTGFKGPWIVAMLDMLGAKTLGFGLAPETTPAMFDLIGGNALCQSVIGDIRDRALLGSTLASFKPDAIIHMAAQSLVRRSYRNPIETFESNVVGTLNVLDALRGHNGAVATVIVTTDKVYAETAAGGPYAEDDKLGGHDPYSTSKAQCELLVESYRRSYFMVERLTSHGKSLASARAGNVIGGGDWCEDRLIPDLARALAAGTSVRVRNPRSVRPWQHVLEPLTGYLTLAARLMHDPKSCAGAYNFGPDDGDVLEVERVIQQAIEAFGRGRYHIDIDPTAPHEAVLLRIASDRAHRDLGWMPRWNAATAIEKTMRWYRDAPAASLEVTRRQISEYGTG